MYKRTPGGKGAEPFVKQFVYDMPVGLFQNVCHDPDLPRHKSEKDTTSSRSLSGHALLLKKFLTLRREWYTLLVSSQDETPHQQFYLLIKGV